jgi:hypothetical protein
MVGDASSTLSTLSSVEQPVKETGRETQLPVVDDTPFVFQGTSSWPIIHFCTLFAKRADKSILDHCFSF